MTPRSNTSGLVLIATGSEKTPRPLPSAVTVKLHSVWEVKVSELK